MSEAAAALAAIEGLRKDLGGYPQVIARIDERLAAVENDTGDMKGSLEKTSEAVQGIVVSLARDAGRGAVVKDHETRIRKLESAPSPEKLVKVVDQVTGWKGSLVVIMMFLGPLVGSLIALWLSKP